MQDRISTIKRNTKETNIRLQINIDGTGKTLIKTGIPLFDHMLTLFSFHGGFDLDLQANGDIDVDHHHTVEDVGICLGDAIDSALGDRKGINRYGHAVTPMDEALSSVSIDLSNRPYLVYQIPQTQVSDSFFNLTLAKEFFQAFVNMGKLNLHITNHYGENNHHIIESIFKSLGRALNHACAMGQKNDYKSTKGVL